jgi:hypothetical protein
MTLPGVYKLAFAKGDVHRGCYTASEAIPMQKSPFSTINRIRERRVEVLVAGSHSLLSLRLAQQARSSSSLTRIILVHHINLSSYMQDRSTDASDFHDQIGALVKCFVLRRIRTALIDRPYGQATRCTAAAMVLYFCLCVMAHSLIYDGYTFLRS